MAGVTQTSYTLQSGGGSGWINIGGWPGALTANDQTAQCVCGTERREGANLYQYCYCTGAIATGNFLAIATATADTNAVVPAIVLSALGATAIVSKWFAVAIQSTTGAMYQWVLRRGFAFLLNDTQQTASIVGASTGGFCISTNTAHCIMGATTTQQGFVVQNTSIATGATGLCFFNLIT